MGSVVGQIDPGATLRCRYRSPVCVDRWQRKCIMCMVTKCKEIYICSGRVLLYRAAYFSLRDPPSHAASSPETRNSVHDTDAISHPQLTAPAGSSTDVSHGGDSHRHSVRRRATHPAVYNIRPCTVAVWVHSRMLGATQILPPAAAT